MELVIRFKTNAECKAAAAVATARGAAVSDEGSRCTGIPSLYCRLGSGLGSVLAFCRWAVDAQLPLEIGAAGGDPKPLAQEDLERVVRTFGLSEPYPGGNIMAGLILGMADQASSVRNQKEEAEKTKRKAKEDYDWFQNRLNEVNSLRYEAEAQRDRYKDALLRLADQWLPRRAKALIAELIQADGRY